MNPGKDWCEMSKIVAHVSKFDIRPKFEYQRRISNVKMRYSDPVRISKQNFECQDAIFGPNSNVKIEF